MSNNWITQWQIAELIVRAEKAERERDELREALQRCIEELEQWHDAKHVLAIARAALETKHPCDDGCQYAKDVGMLEHSCGNGCMYDRAALEAKP